MIPVVALLLITATAETATISVTLTPTAADPLPDPIEIVGNEALPEPVYEALIDPPRRWTPAALRKVERDLLRFLHRAGFELAQVHATAEHGQVKIEIDEGRLERVVFPGESGLGALRLQLFLDMPGNVFNRKLLDEQLEYFRREMGVLVDEYKLVPVKGSSTAPTQLEDLGAIRGIDVIPEIGRYELQVFVKERDLPPGIALELQGVPADGIVSRVEYRFADLLFDDDRTEAGGILGVRVGKVFGGSSGDTWVSRAGVSADWLTPPLWGPALRGVLSQELFWLSRSRLDIGVPRYDLLAYHPLLLARIRPSRFMELWAGGGLSIDQLVLVATDDPALKNAQPPLLQPVLAARGEIGFGSEALRLDRLQRIKLRADQTFGSQARLHLAATYQTSIGFGWDDLVIKSSIAGVVGSPPFYDLERVADQLKGLSGDKIYSRAVWGAGVEYRLSIARELFKLSASWDGAVFRREVDVVERGRAGFAQAVALGSHAMLLDTFRLSIYVAVGLFDTSEIDQGVSLSLSQVF